MTRCSHGSEAFGRPGGPARWTSSAKQGICTAYSTSSRVWFTISHGILNEIYYPTIDHPQTRDLQFLVTDGKTYFHEEKRDLLHETRAINDIGLGYHVVSRDRDGRYQIDKRLICDPHQPCVLMHVSVTGQPEVLRDMRLYALLAPHLELGGGHNSASHRMFGGKTVMIAWKGQTTLAFGGTADFVRTSCGFVGASDGWLDLRENMQMDWEFCSATDGNIAMTAQIDPAAIGDFTLAVGFGETTASALTSLGQSLAVPFNEHLDRFLAQWGRVNEDRAPMNGLTGDGNLLYRTSHQLLLAHEDKSYAGAIIASASIPWGQTRGDDDLGAYHLVWVRDMVNAAGALLALGDCTTSLRALIYLTCCQDADGGFAQNFWLDGRPYWTSIQLDETAFAILLAWRAWREGVLRLFDPYRMVTAAARFLVHMGPITPQERWEGARGFSPSTLAAQIAAIICAADFARDREDETLACFFEEYADFLESHVDGWTATTQGALLKGVSRHYIRLLPVAEGDASPIESPNCAPAMQHVPPGVCAKDVVDAGFLWLVRLGIRAADSALMRDSLAVVDAVLKVETPCGPCWRRYSHDTYGEYDDGRPYDGSGVGRAWPLLVGERGHYELSAGGDAKAYLRQMERFAADGGLLAEQVWDAPDIPRRELFLGKPTGSARPLVWAHAEYVKLLRSVHDGRPFDLVWPAQRRYIERRGRSDLEMWQFLRQVKRVKKGTTLRVLAKADFRLRWSNDQWRSTNDTPAASPVHGVYYVDIAVTESQQVPVQFTFFWTKAGKWEGADYEVDVD